MHRGSQGALPPCVPKKIQVFEHFANTRTAVETHSPEISS
jgi:hypothetical protein